MHPLPLFVIMVAMLVVLIYAIVGDHFWTLMGVVAAAFAFTIWHRIHYGFYPEQV